MHYIRTHYDNIYFAEPSYSNQLAKWNILSRIVDNFITAIQKHTLLPKAVVIVLDDDIMDNLNHYEKGISQAVGIMLEWLAQELHEVITSHKKALPMKARKF